MLLQAGRRVRACRRTTSTRNCATICQSTGRSAGVQMESSLYLRRPNLRRLVLSWLTGTRLPKG
jgi:hypothetical protein